MTGRKKRDSVACPRTPCGAKRCAASQVPSMDPGSARLTNGDLSEWPVLILAVAYFAKSCQKPERYDGMADNYKNDWQLHRRFRRQRIHGLARDLPAVPLVHDRRDAHLFSRHGQPHQMAAHHLGKPPV